MYICMYISIYVYICMYTYMCYLYGYIPVCVYIYMCVYTYIYIYIFYIHIRSPHMLGTQHALILLDSRVVILKSSGIWPLCPAIRDLLGVIEETLASQGVGDLR